MSMEANQRWVVIYEHPLPPPEAPVTIEDSDYTFKPTASREILANCLRSLAYKVKMSLDVDYDNNQRYARRLRLDNRTDDFNGREEFIVQLPIDANCWNDVDHETIELTMLKTILKQVDSDTHIWYQMRAQFDDYIDPLTRDFMEKLDRGESLHSVKIPNIPQEVETKPIPEPYMTAGTSTAHQDNQLQVVPKVAEVITISDDEDDIVVVE